MAIDSKYGQVTFERGTIGVTEPVVVFRAQDRLLLKVLAVYSDYCQLAGSEVEHLHKIDDAARAVADWQVQHGAKTPGTPQ